jgi:PAS domain S-box-containing protein
MQRFVSLLILNIMVSLAVGISIFWLLYSTAFEQAQGQLLTIVESRRALMEAVEAFDAEFSSGYPGGARLATLSQIESAHVDFGHFGKTGEFAVAELKNDEIAFFFRQRHSGLQKPYPIPINAILAEPMRRALKGETGSTIAPDYRGRLVLAAFTPVPALKVGLVAKIDMREIRQPFVRAAVLGFVVSIFLFGCSSFVFVRIVSPISQEIKESEELYRNLIEGQSELVYRSQMDGTLSFVNEAYCKYFDRIPNELLGKKFTDFIPIDRRSSVLEEISSLSPTNRSITHEHEVISANGKNRWMQWTVSLLLSDTGKAEEIVSVGLDVTDHKRAEQLFERVNRARMVLLRSHDALITIKKPDILLREVCRLLVEDAGYPLAWVGRAEDDAEKSVCPVARYGDNSDYLDDIKISWDDVPSGKGPSGTAIRTGEPVVFMDLSTNPNFEDFREAALKRGFLSSISIPMDMSDGRRGTLNIYASEPDAFDNEERDLLLTLAEDISYGIRSIDQITLRENAEYDVGLSKIKLKESLLTTISALAHTIEQRDPYTAGHQSQVSNLAVAIGYKMGVSTDVIEGVRMGSIIHDIGKISVPSEILTKPSKLTVTEYELIKAHAENGYQIIKDIQFEWPICDIVWQHHERLDGTGYPQGLKGDDILLESRIVAVADVVDAIVSHRPYRPARDVSIAIEELNAYKGVRYDSEVVDACVELLNIDGYLKGQRDDR